MDIQGIPLDRLFFDDYWPQGSPELVMEFLRTAYDPATMPPLEVAVRDDGTYALIGWRNESGGPGLLEAARGWGLTEDESEWVRVWAESVAKE